MTSPLVSPEKWIALEQRLKKLKVSPKDLEESFISGNGKGGQKQNKTQNTVQLKHIPSNIVITCQAYRERERNRYRAKTQLCERLEQKQSGKTLSAKQEKIKKQKERQKRRQNTKSGKIENKINWFPGHMAKTLSKLKEQLKHVDIVIELRDARAPLSSYNHELNNLYQHKEKIIVLSKIDLADPIKTKTWQKKLAQSESCMVLTLNLKNNKDILKLEKSCEYIRQKKEKQKAHSLAYNALHILVLGIPNVGKSQLINQWRKKKITQVANKPGVTKSLQWIAIKNTLLVLDSPGLLWPNLQDQEQATKLALLAAIKENILIKDELCQFLISFLMAHYPKALLNYYEIEEIAEDPETVINRIAIKRGYLIKGHDIDKEKTVAKILHDFQHEKLGRISLE